MRSLGVEASRKFPPRYNIIITLFITFLLLFSLSMVLYGKDTEPLVGSVSHGGPGFQQLRNVNYETEQKNTTLVGHWRFGPCNVAEVKDSKVYFGHNGYLQIADVSDPDHPNKLGKIVLPGTVEGITVEGGYAYVSNGDAGLRIIDISDPTSPTEVGFFKKDGWSFKAFEVSIEGDYAYLAAHGSLEIIDISDPTSPTEVGFFDVYDHAEGVAVKENFAYLADGYDGLRVIDISDPSSPSEVGFLKTEDATGVVVRGNYAYLAVGGDGMKIVNITDPSHPYETGDFNEYEYINDIAVSGDFAFLTVGNSGLRIIDISNPSSPTKVSFFEMDNATGVTIVGDYAYVAAKHSGLRIVNISNPSSPTEVSLFDTGGIASAVTLHEGNVYVTKTGSWLNTDGGLRIIDASTPSNPSEVGFLDTEVEKAKDIAVHGDYAYLAVTGPGSNKSGLLIVDISDPSSPFVYNFFASSSPRGITIRGDYAYLADGHEGLKILDISNPASPSEIGIIEMSFPIEVKIKGDYAYVADGGLRVVDISNPASPSEVGFFDMDSAGGISIKGDYAYLADGYGGDGIKGLRIFDISDPASPSEVSSFYTDVGPEGVTVEGDYAYLADGYKGLKVLDISDPASPSEVGFFATGFSEAVAREVTVKNNLAYLAYEEAGLYIIRNDSADGDDIPPTLVQDFNASDGEDGQSTLTWTNPDDSDLSEVQVRRKTDSFPSNHNDGNKVDCDISSLPGESNSCRDTGLTNEETYYYAVFSKDYSQNWNDNVKEGSNADTGIIGEKSTDGIQDLSVTGVDGADRLIISWTNPPAEDLAEVKLTWKLGSFPQDHNDGHEVNCDINHEPSASNSCVHTDLRSDWVYRYSVFTKDSSGNWDDDIVQKANTAIGVPAPVRLQVPYFNQGDSLLCGPTSAAMILHYFRINKKPWEVASGVDWETEDWFSGLVNYLNNADGDEGEEWIDEEYNYDKEKTIKDKLIQGLEAGSPVWFAFSKKEWNAAHAVVITGYSGSDYNQDFVFYHDPSGALSGTTEVSDNIEVRMVWRDFFDKIETTFMGIQKVTYIHAKEGAFNTTDAPVTASLLPEHLEFLYGGEILQLKYDSASQNGYLYLCKSDNSCSSFPKDKNLGHAVTGSSSLYSLEANISTSSLWKLPFEISIEIISEKTDETVREFNYQMTLPPNSADLTTGPAVESINTYISESGLYAVRVSVADQENKSIVYDEFSVKFRVVAVPQFKKGWNLFSPPGEPLKPDPEKSLGNDIDSLTLYYDYTSRDGYTVYPSDTDTTQLRWKEGYWVHLTNESDVNMAAEVPDQNQTLQFTEQGWHMIGLPFPVDWSQASFSDPADFANDGAGNVRLISWSPSDGQYLNHYTDTSYVLSSWGGYWVYVKDASSSDPATITISYTMQPPSTPDTQTPLPQSVNRKQLSYPPKPKSPKDDIKVFAYPNPVMETDQITFTAQMAGVEKIKVTVTNMAGEVVYNSGYKSGSKLTWGLKSSSGNKVANGIYLYKIQATEADGTTQASEVNRLLVLR